MQGSDGVFLQVEYSHFKYVRGMYMIWQSCECDSRAVDELMKDLYEGTKPLWDHKTPNIRLDQDYYSLN